MQEKGGIGQKWRREMGDIDAKVVVLIGKDGLF